ncbi:MAG TPA: hypothetical protein VGL58_03965 [Caulobacteraceae bacterium]|jgi:hypothetical protein
MSRLRLILSVAYWLIAGGLLWLGYQGDVDIDRASTTPVTHSAAFDAAAGLGLALVVYLAAAAIWWMVARVGRRAPVS